MKNPLIYLLVVIFFGGCGLVDRGKPELQLAYIGQRGGIPGKRQGCFPGW